MKLLRLCFLKPKTWPKSLLSASLGGAMIHRNLPALTVKLRIFQRIISNIPHLCGQVTVAIFMVQDTANSFLIQRKFAGVTFLCMIGCCFGCCLVPFCVDRLKNVRHTCPKCGHVVGYHRFHFFQSSECYPRALTFMQSLQLLHFRDPSGLLLRRG